MYNVNHRNIQQSAAAAALALSAEAEAKVEAQRPRISSFRTSESWAGLVSA